MLLLLSRRDFGNDKFKMHVRAQSGEFGLHERLCVPSIVKHLEASSRGRLDLSFTISSSMAVMYCESMWVDSWLQLFERVSSVSENGSSSLTWTFPRHLRRLAPLTPWWGVAIVMYAPLKVSLFCKRLTKNDFTTIPPILWQMKLTVV